MADYRLTNHAFSRQWRRSKTYSEREIKWLARKRRLEFKTQRHTVQVLDPKSKKVVASFQLVPEPEAVKIDERTRNFAALRNG